FADRAANRRPGVTLDREVDVGVRIRFPALAFQHPAWLAAAAGLAPARNEIAEFAVRVLRVFLEETEPVQALLIAQLHAAQVEHAVLHRYRDLLPLARLVTADQRRQDADGQVHAGIAVTERRCADGRRAVPEPRGRRRAARALRDVFVDLQVIVMV